jgi:transcriptional regulator with XRE-family HTH domain
LTFFSKGVEFASRLNYNSSKGGVVMDISVKIGERIKRLRISQKLTQDELAIKSGYTSRSSINKIEKGLVDLPRSKIVDIANALGTTPSYLMGWEDETPAPELTESERAWLQLYRKVSPDVRETFVMLVEKFDSLPTAERQMLLSWIRAAIDTQAK